MKKLRSAMLPLCLMTLTLGVVLLPADETRKTALPGRYPSLLSVQMAPGIDIPLGESEPLFGLGGGAILGMQYRLPAVPAFYLSGNLGVSFDSANGVLSSVSMISASLGAGLRIDLTPWLSTSIGISGGYFGCLLNGPFEIGGNPFVSADAGIMLLPSPWHITLGVSYRYLWRFYTGLAASVGLSVEVPPATSGSAAPTGSQTQGTKAKPLKTPVPQQPPPEKPSAGIKDVVLEDIFPVFRTYYDAHPLGKAVLRNSLDQPITDIKVSFQIKEFMDDPKESQAPALLKPGETQTVDLFGLFRSNILEITEATKAQAKISIDYTFKGQVLHQSLVKTIRILDRNATSWTDDRRAAAFVTAKDPAVLAFAKNVSSIVKGKAQGAINANFLTALALHETLHLFGLTYSADPIPTAAANGPATDYIQFPRQTLEYKGGKCSDLSVLYSALLESAGTETAFITVPGHIFMAFSLGVSPDEARKDFSHPDELIFRYGKSWVPIEVTESAGFLEAWRDGAKEWRENLRTDQADFYPLHEAWQVYEPVGLPGAGATVILPPSEEIVDRYRNEIAAFVTQEITYRIAALRQQTKTPEDQRKLGNATGVLYAKYGLFDRAQQEFDKLIAEEEYVPALVNMGNTYFATGEKEKALEYYRRAYVKDPGDPKAVLAFARANHDLENYYEAKKVYADLKSQDSALARQFAYLDLKGEEATRQAEISGVAGVLIWDQ